MYTLLTGATGMLGRFVLRDLLLRGSKVAVLVRPSRRASAAERIDAVLGYWENSWNRTLPRPVVLTGDIAEEGLGLSASDRRWLATNCQSMIHSAASLTFYEEDGEPWRSNVQGVQHVLDTCQDLNIDRMYYVSTAYTCGLRDGIVYEDELDVGQELGNDYERSKVQAEKLVRQADWLDVAAIFRPSIIVGDSLTGFSSTFHGFYTPLRLVYALQTQLSHEQVFATDHMAVMGLSGDEGKNLVPVEWVGQAITEIIQRYPTQSRTYALTSTSPVTSARMLRVIRAVTQEHAPKRRAPNTAAPSSVEQASADPLHAVYLQQLQTYRSYWRNDPIFDCSHTVAALPDLPCPVLSDETLMRLAEWAIQAKFAAPVGTPQVDPRARILADRDQQPSAAAGTLPGARVVTITGPGGGSWTFDAGNSAGSLRVWEGRCDGAPELRIHHEAFQQFIAGDSTLNELALAGDLVTIGRNCDIPSWQHLLAAARDQSLIAAGA